MTAADVTRGRSHSVLVGSLLLLSTGCVATRNDVRILQGDIAALRTELLRDDAEHRDALAQAIKLVAIANDSLARISMRTVGTQGDVRGEMRTVRDQLQQLQQLVVQLQGSINRTRADFEERTNAVLNAAGAAAVGGTPPAGAPGTTGAGMPSVPSAGAATAAAAGSAGLPAASPMAASPTAAPVAGGSDAPASRGPGPLQLYNSGLDQLKRGSTATARTLFQELLATAPANEHAPDAQFYIAESLFREKNLAGADAAYAAVVAKFPQSPRAATAHYKRAQIAVQQGNLTDARKLLTEVITRFPSSSEAVLAADQLKQLR